MKSILNKQVLTAIFATTFLGLTLVSCGEKAAEPPPAAEVAAPASEAAAPAASDE